MPSGISHQECPVSSAVPQLANYEGTMLELFAELGATAMPVMYCSQREAAFAAHLRATADVLRVRVEDAEPGPQRDHLLRRLTALEDVLPHRT